MPNDAYELRERARPGRLAERPGSPWLARLGRFGARLNRFGTRNSSPEPLRDAPGLDFRAQNGCFFDVFLHEERSTRKTSEVLKTSIFPWFFACRKLFAQVQKRRKIARGACPTELPTKIALKTRLGTRCACFWMGLALSWAALGRHLADFWALLGDFWSLLGTSWPPLGLFWALLVAALACQLRSGSPRTLQDRFGNDFRLDFGLFFRDFERPQR